MATQLIFLIIIILLAIRCLLNWSRHSSVPGPFLATISDIWRAYYQYRGLLRSKLLSLHKKHGPVVRYGVNSISISDPSAIPIIYGSRAGFITADSYHVLVGISNGKEVASLVSTSDETKHGLLRRSVSKAFTPHSSLSYEVFVDQTIPELISALERHKIVDLPQLMIYYSMDAASRISFSESLGCLNEEKDVGGIIQLIRDRFNHWGWWSSIPGIESLVFRNWYSMRMKRAPSSMAAKAVSKLQSRLSSTKDGTKKEHEDLLDKFIQASMEYPDTLDTSGIVGLLMSTISGAGDTTATTLTAIIYHILQHPLTLQRLQREITSADLADTEIPSFEEVKDLPYLNAIIKESMRNFSTPTFPMERKVPKDGAAISGHFFREGTEVGCLPSAVHDNPLAFGDDAEQFRPERWLDGNEGKVKGLEAAHLGFSRGRRVCLGQHIAVMQMKKVVVLLILRFRMSLVDPEKQLEADMSPAVACLKPLYINVEIKDAMSGSA